jgi:hypothetical protein
MQALQCSSTRLSRPCRPQRTACSAFTGDTGLHTCGVYAHTHTPQCVAARGAGVIWRLCTQHPRVAAAQLPHCCTCWAAP